MIQDGDEVDRETGEVKWEDANDEDEVPDEKIFIGRVSSLYCSSQYCGISLTGAKFSTRYL